MYSLWVYLCVLFALAFIALCVLLIIKKIEANTENIISTIIAGMASIGIFISDKYFAAGPG
jgi:hypothetical protein